MNMILPPGDNEVHLYCITLPNSPSEQSRFEHLLSTVESYRADLLKDNRAKKRYIAGRGVLREILGGYLGVAPGKVLITTGMHGKPYLAECAEKIRFNLSHTGDVLLLAVSGRLEVGVDIETMETEKPLIDMAKLSFSHQEQGELLSIPAGLRTAAFYRCWVRKEACMKACGTGFSLASNSFTISLRNDMTLSQKVFCNQTAWHILDINVPHRYCAALAVEALTSSPPPTPVLINHHGIYEVY
jgi:4'-phosphopantetheinyl transferase